jgi:hypothetical protein
LGVATAVGSWCGVVVGFGVAKFAGPAAGVDAGVGCGFVSVVGVATARGVAETCGLSPGGTPPVLGVAVGVGFSAVVGEGFGTFRFGGVDFWIPGDGPGTVPVGDCFSPGVLGGVAFPLAPAGEGAGVPEAFRPRRFGGIGLFPPTDGEPPGVPLTTGVPAPGFTTLGGVWFCPVTGVGAPGTPEGAACPLVRICGGATGVGFGKSFGTGFWAAIACLRFVASAGFTSCHPFWITGLAIRV